ncbi:MAG TPA: hypothetical protein VFA67_01055 [Candidatus Sulfotelmatobacter sp.]|nr:hypothetical protein [Candidatus Sulfotelmatobacter sp.]
MRLALFWTVLISIGAVVLAYVSDTLVFRVRAGRRDAYGSVVVTHYYAVPQKNGKTQFLFDPPASESCVNALFPRAGLRPCWYLRRHREQRTDI